MKYSRLIAFMALLTAIVLTTGAQQSSCVPVIEVTGSATINIIPDRITIEIGIEEYYKQKVFGDSTIVKLADIERDVRKTLNEAGVPDSLIIVSDLGNYRNRNISSTFLMAKSLSATVSDINQIDRISDRLDRKGITCFNITKTDNTDIEKYNRKGLQAALDAAREKASFIAENEGLKITIPYEIVENGPNYYDTPSFSNVSLESGAGMENMRRIVRRYSVKVKYLFDTVITE